MALQIARVAVVIILVGVAAAIATPPGKIPLALRGVAKLFNIQTEVGKTPTWKKLLAFVLVVGATIIAVL